MPWIELLCISALIAAFALLLLEVRLRARRPGRVHGGSLCAALAAAAAWVQPMAPRYAVAVYAAYVMLILVPMYRHLCTRRAVCPPWEMRVVAGVHGVVQNGALALLPLRLLLLAALPASMVAACAGALAAAFLDGTIVGVYDSRVSKTTANVLGRCSKELVIVHVHWPMADALVPTSGMLKQHLAGRVPLGPLYSGIMRVLVLTGAQSTDPCARQRVVDALRALEEDSYVNVAVLADAEWTDGAQTCEVETVCPPENMCRVVVSAPNVHLSLVRCTCPPVSGDISALILDRDDMDEADAKRLHGIAKYDVVLRPARPIFPLFGRDSLAPLAAPLAAPSSSSYFIRLQ